MRVVVSESSASNWRSLCTQRYHIIYPLAVMDGKCWIPFVLSAMNVL